MRMRLFLVEGVPHRGGTVAQSKSLDHETAKGRADAKREGHKIGGAWGSWSSCFASFVRLRAFVV